MAATEYARSAPEIFDTCLLITWLDGFRLYRYKFLSGFCFQAGMAGSFYLRLWGGITLRRNTIFYARPAGLHLKHQYPCPWSAQWIKRSPLSKYIMQKANK